MCSLFLRQYLLRLPVFYIAKFWRPVRPGCILCKTHAGCTPVAPQVYANVRGWRTPEVQRSEEPCVEKWIFYASTPKIVVRIYPRRHADRKANCTREIFGPKCMECTLAVRVHNFCYHETFDQLIFLSF